MGGDVTAPPGSAPTRPVAGPSHGGTGGSIPGPAGRLRRPTDVRRVLTHGARRSGRLVVLYVAPGDSLRSAFVAGRKVGGAVVRNRARRLMREAWRGVASRVRPGHDVLFAARTGIRDATMGEVLEEMTRLLANQGLIGP